MYFALIAYIAIIGIYLNENIFYEEIFNKILDFTQNRDAQLSELHEKVTNEKVKVAELETKVKFLEAEKNRLESEKSKLEEENERLKTVKKKNWLNWFFEQ